MAYRTSAYYDSDNNDLLSLPDDDNTSDVESLFDAEYYAETSAAHEQSSSARQAAKAIQVAQDAIPTQAPRAGNAPSFHTASQLERSESNDYGRLFDAGPAPPDYNAATTSPRRVLGSARPAQSMSNRQALYTDDENAVLQFRTLDGGTFSRRGDTRWPLWIRRWFPSRDRLIYRRPTASLVLVVLIISVLIFKFSSGHGTTAIPATISNSPPANATERVDWKTTPAYLDDPEYELHLRTDQKYAGYQDFHFERPDSFSIIEDTGCGTQLGSLCAIYGNVKATRVYLNADTNMSLPAGVGLMVRVGMSISDDYLVKDFNVLQKGESITLGQPNVGFASSGKHLTWKELQQEPSLPLPSFKYWVAIYVREDVNLTNWNADLRYLDFGSNAPRPVTGNSFSTTELSRTKRTITAVRVENSTIINARYAEIYMMDWDSRNLHISTRTGYVGGRYRFREELTIDAWQNNIMIWVDPVWHSDANIRRLSTSNVEGNTTVYIMSPLPPLPSEYGKKAPKEPFRVEGTHRSASGFLKLEYSPEFQGTIEGFSMEGEVEISGGANTGSQTGIISTHEPGGVEVSTSKEYPRYRWIGSLSFETALGDVQVTVGEWENKIAWW